MKKIIPIMLVLILSAIVFAGCSSSSDYYDSTGETIREELGNGPADAYYTGKARWNAMTNQD